MKVAFISRNTLFTGRGGDTIQVVKTAEYLEKLGVKVDIYTGAQKIDYNSYDLIHGFNLARPIEILKHFKQVNKPKVLSTIFVQYDDYDKNDRAGLLGKISKLTNQDITEYLKTIARWIKNNENNFDFNYLLRGHKTFCKDLLKESHLLLPNSESEYVRLRNHFGVSYSYKVIPNAIDTKIFDPKMVCDNKQKNLVLCVARIDGLKNQLNLIQALKNTPFELILIGKPAPNHLSYYKQCRLEAGSNVTFIDHLNQKDLIPYYCKAKVHAMPSWFETTGLSSLEAAAMNCNLVISSNGDTIDYFGDSAFYASPDNRESIYKAILSASNANAPESFRKEVFEKYTWEITAQKTLEAYEQLVTKSAVT